MQLRFAADAIDVSVPDRRPGSAEETKSLLTMELWQLVVIVVGFLALVGHFLLGAGLPQVGMQGLLVLFLLVVLAGLLVLRARKRSGG